MSQVVTLYKDKEKTDALYPRTKVSAISDDNNTSLQELLNRYEIIDNLTSYDKDKALSANQGRELNDTFKNYYDKTEVNDLLDNIDITGMIKQEEGGTQEEVVTPTNADTLGGKLTANNVVFYEEEITDEVGQVVLRNADLLDNHQASYFATSEDLNVVSEDLNTAIANSGKFYGIDTSRLLASSISISTNPYTATEDCYAMVSFTADASYAAVLFIDGVQVIATYVPLNGVGGIFTVIPLKKGQVLSSSRQKNARYDISYVFGIKE